MHYLASAIAFFTLCQMAASKGGIWLTPSQPNFSQSYANADSIVFQWQGLNDSLSDLWLTSFDTTDNYALRIATNMNISVPGSFPWIITVNQTEIDIDNRFRLRFIPTGTVYQTTQTDQFASPGFLLRQRVEAPPTSSTSAGTTVLAAASSTEIASLTSVPGSAASSTLFSPPDGQSGMQTGTKVGIAIAAVASVVIIVALLLWIIRLRRRINAAANHRSQGIIPPAATGREMACPGAQSTQTALTKVKRISGLHEALGDRCQPIELNATATKNEVRMYHELAG